MLYVWYMLQVFQIENGMALKVPAQLCQNERAGELFSLPMPLNCGEPSNYKLWQVRLEKLNIREYSSKANSVQVFERTCKTGYSFFGVKTRTQWTKKLRLERDMAEQLINQHACIEANGKITMKLTEGAYDCRWKWMTKQETRTISCHLANGNIYARHDGRVKTDLTSFKGCRFEDQYCFTSDGVHLTWKVVPEVSLIYTVVDIFNATKIKNHLLISDLGMAFKIPESILNTTKEDFSWVDREYRLTKLRMNKVVGSHMLQADSDVIQALKNEINSKFAFLVDMMNSPTTKAAYLCEVWNQIYQTERSMAMMDPTLYIREKTKNPLLMAKALGDYVITYPCLAVEKYEWKMDETTKCYAGVPIRYKIKGSEEMFDGFLQPKYNNILTDGIEVECHEREKVFTNIDGNIQLHSIHTQKVVGLNESQAINLQHSPTPGIGKVDFINTRWAYSAEDMTHVEIERQILEQVTNDLSYRKQQDSKTIGIGLGWKFFGIFEASIPSLFSAILMWVERIILIVILYEVFLKYRVKQWLRRKKLGEGENTELIAVSTESGPKNTQI